MKILQIITANDDLHLALTEQNVDDADALQWDEIQSYYEDRGISAPYVHRSAELHSFDPIIVDLCDEENFPCGTIVIIDRSVDPAVINVIVPEEQAKIIINTHNEDKKTPRHGR